MSNKSSKNTHNLVGKKVRYNLGRGTFETEVTAQTGNTCTLTHADGKPITRRVETLTVL